MTDLGITGAADTVASVLSMLASTDGNTTNSFGFDLDAVASTDGVANSCEYDALETAASFEHCGAMVLFDLDGAANSCDSEALETAAFFGHCGAMVLFD